MERFGLMMTDLNRVLVTTEPTKQMWKDMSKKSQDFHQTVVLNSEKIGRYLVSS